MAFKNYAKKVGKKLRSKAIRRYFKPKSNYTPKMGNIMKDVAYLKSVLNPEKKTYNFTITDAQVGQCAVNNNGLQGYDITPNPAQGTTSITRNGNSIKVHSAHIRYQLQAMSGSNGSPIRFKIVVFHCIGQVQTFNTAITTMYDPNPFVGGGTIRDYFSDRNPEAFKQYKVIREKYVYMKANNHTGQKQLISGSFGIKFKNHHVKFLTDGSQSIQDGQYMIVVFADNGNASTGTASTLTGTAETAISTGAYLQLDITQWFYDN